MVHCFDQGCHFCIFVFVSFFVSTWQRTALRSRVLCCSQRFLLLHPEVANIKLEDGSHSSMVRTLHRAYMYTLGAERL